MGTKKRWIDRISLESLVFGAIIAIGVLVSIGYVSFLTFQDYDRGHQEQTHQ